DRSWQGGPAVQNRIDHQQLKQWTSCCLESHAVFCDNAPYKHTIPDLLVIDCKSRDIIRAPLDAEYVALSYLWGPASENDKVHTNSLREKQAPLTVEDAMLVVLKLGLQYLWVDRYCIDQSDSDSKHYMISQMDRIYMSAKLAIIAA
ncbi:heterokaryon incompatibility protein-domain-containing protein, partial [Cladorrhinum sp. PSN259]